MEAQVSVEKYTLTYDFGKKPPSGVKFRWTADGKAELYTDDSNKIVSQNGIPADKRQGLGNGSVKTSGNYVIVEFNKTPTANLTDYSSYF